MVSTAVYPALGSSAPAAFARPVIDDLRSLGFTGVVVTDALQTPAVNATRTTGTAAVDAIAAGADLALAAGPSSSPADTDGAADAAYAALLAAARSGKLSHARLLAAYAHVLALKRA
jgi:beta-N-acetylhexosaminidase